MKKTIRNMSTEEINIEVSRINTEMGSYTDNDKNLYGWVVNFLFTLNAGGLAGFFAVVATKPSFGLFLIWSGVLFLLSFLLAGLWIAWQLYYYRSLMNAFVKDINCFYQNTISNEELWNNENNREKEPLVFHILPWASCFFVIVASVCLFIEIFPHGR